MKIMIGLGILAVFTVIFNCIGPWLYIQIRYPGSKIVKSSAYNSGGGLVGPTSPPGKRYLNYDIYNSAEDVGFSEGFELAWYFPFYIPYSLGRNHLEEAIEGKNKENEMLSDISEIVGRYTDKSISLKTPKCFSFYQSTYYFRYYIFVNYLEPENAGNLIDDLNRYVDRNRNDKTYASYEIYFCMDDELFDEIQKIDYEYAGNNIEWGGTYLHYALNELNYKITTISRANYYSNEAYANRGDSSYSNYQDPDNFSHLIFIYSKRGESTYPHEEYFLFGINKNSDQ